MSVSAVERGIPHSQEAKEQKHKPLGRTLVVDHEGQSMDAITAFVTKHATSVEQYSTIENALAAVVDDKDAISAVVSAYSIPDEAKRTGVDVIRAVKGKYPGVRAVLISAIPELIGKLPDVQSLNVPLIAKEDQTKINKKTDEERAVQAAQVRHEFNQHMSVALFGKEVIL